MSRISLIFEEEYDPSGADDGKLIFDHNEEKAWVRSEVEDDCYNFTVDLSEEACKLLIAWLQGVVS